MKTVHEIIFSDARNMELLDDESVELVVTSPPYPMIAMWDDVFSVMDPAVADLLKEERGNEAWEAMHRQLDQVWSEVYRCLKKGGFACINIGDATRTMDGHFRLYPNHARILSSLTGLGFTILPAVLWRKQTNAPNKFMGSGMLPAGAYVTLEHEYILIARKGNRRVFASADTKQRRHGSALFWEERNHWFSDVWMELKGTRQAMVDPQHRQRSGAFPFELPFRLISMYSVQGDTVLDPFMGIGTTALAAMATGRSSVGFELEKGFSEMISARAGTIVDEANAQIDERLNRHLAFVKSREASGKPVKHWNRHYGFGVMTSQEKELVLPRPVCLEKLSDSRFEVTFDDSAKAILNSIDADIEDTVGRVQVASVGETRRSDRKKTSQQLSLFD